MDISYSEVNYVDRDVAIPSMTGMECSSVIYIPGERVLPTYVGKTLSHVGYPVNRMAGIKCAVTNLLYRATPLSHDPLRSQLLTQHTNK